MFQKLSLVVQVILVIAASQIGLFAWIFYGSTHPALRGFRYFFEVLVLVQLSLIALNLLIHGIIFKKSKQLANQVTIYHDNDVNVDVNQSYDAVAELGTEPLKSHHIIFAVQNFLRSSFKFDKKIMHNEHFLQDFETSDIFFKIHGRILKKVT